MNTSTREWYERFYETRPDDFSPWYAAMAEYLRETGCPGRLVELGCGKGELLLHLVENGIVGRDDVTGIEQSAAAISAVRDVLTNIVQGDITDRVPLESSCAGVVVMAEVIEHLPDPAVTLREIRRILADGGRFIMSFPNYTNLPWLALRVLAQMLRKPSWIVLQPIDHIFFFHGLVRNIERHGFVCEYVTARVFLPPVLYRYEPRWLTRWLNRSGMSWLGFHPVIVFRKR